MGNAYTATAAVNVYAQAPIPGCYASRDGAGNDTRSLVIMLMTNDHVYSELDCNENVARLA